MIFGSRKVAHWISGMNTSGSTPFSSSRYFRSPSISICSGRPQWAQAVRIVTETGSFRKRPCTKGVAIASSAQAAYRRSPLRKVSW